MRDVGALVSGRTWNVVASGVPTLLSCFRPVRANGCRSRLRLPLSSAPGCRLAGACAACAPRLQHTQSVFCERCVQPREVTRALSLKRGLFFCGHQKTLPALGQASKLPWGEHSQLGQSLAGVRDGYVSFPSIFATPNSEPAGALCSQKICAMQSAAAVDRATGTRVQVANGGQRQGRRGKPRGPETSIPRYPQAFRVRGEKQAVALSRTGYALGVATWTAIQFRSLA